MQYNHNPYNNIVRHELEVDLPLFVATSSPVVLIHNTQSIRNSRRPVEFDVKTCSLFGVSVEPSPSDSGPHVVGVTPLATLRGGGAVSKVHTDRGVCLSSLNISRFVTWELMVA